MSKMSVSPGETTFERKRNRRRNRWVIGSFHCLCLFWILNALFGSNGLSAGKIAVGALLLASVGLLALQIGSKKSPTHAFDSISLILLAPLLFWCLVTIARGIQGDPSRLLTLVANPDIGGAVWLLPFAVFIGQQPGVFQALLPAFRFHSALGCVLIAWLLFSAARGAQIEESTARVGLILVYAAPFVLLANLGNKHDRRLHLLALGLAATANYLLGNRGGFAVSVGFLLLAVALGRMKETRRAWMRSILLIALVGIVAIFGSDYILSRLSDPWLADTRSFLWEELRNDFSPVDWIFGRGALGQYFSPYFSRLGMLTGEGDSMYRQVNEIGYLHIALKSGLIGVALYLMVILRAMLRCRQIPGRLGIGVMMVLGAHLAELTVIGQASFLPSRLLLWMLVGMGLTANRTVGQEFQ